MGSDYPRAVRRYLGDAVSEMIEAGWAVNLVADEYVYIDGKIDQENRCTGYVQECSFEGTVLHLAVDRDLNDWLGVFLHEFGHFQQWRDRGKKAHDRIAERYEDARCALERWTKKRRRYTPRQLWGFVHRVVAEEADAEMRALRDAAHYNLPLDRDEYVQKANAYMLSYPYMLRQRRCPDPHAALNLNIWGQMSTKTDLLEQPRKLVRSEYLYYEDIFLAHANEED